MRSVLTATGLVTAGLVSFSALATDGYFPHGHGMKAKGMGGAMMAMTADAFGGADNPATMVFVGRRVDLGLEWFRPDRSARRTGSAGGTGALDGAANGNDRQNFFIPEFAYNHMLRSDLSLGVSVVGHGGMNTDYAGGQLDQGICGGGPPNGVPVNLLCGPGQLGVDLSQLVIAPTLAYKVAENHSIGASLLIGYQRFKAYGLGGFAAISSDPANLTNKGYDSAWGVGFRVGYYGRITPTFAIGAAYATKIRMGEFDKYKGLFAEQGGFDIPENYSIGIALKPAPKVTVAADYKRINYSGIRSVGNPSNQLGCAPTFPAGPGVGSACLGASASSIGFGWGDVNVFKLGLEYQWDKRLTLRGGYGHTDNPIQARDVTFNIIAPGVIKDHLTLGFTYALEDKSEITMAYMHAFKNTVSGPATNPYFPVGGTETIELSENSLGIAWAKQF